MGSVARDPYMQTRVRRGTTHHGLTVGARGLAVDLSIAAVAVVSLEMVTVVETGGSVTHLQTVRPVAVGLHMVVSAEAEVAEDRAVPAAVAGIRVAQRHIGHTKVRAVGQSTPGPTKQTRNMSAAVWDRSSSRNFRIHQFGIS